MPTKIPSSGKLLLNPLNPQFVCLACRRKTVSISQKWAQNRWTNTRRASTVSPVSVVNATKHVPPIAQDIYDALNALEKDASVYTNLSQSQLALRGIESQNAITRIAILGINGLHGARRLARVLLADPLAAEQKWEQQLTEDDADGRAILLRYGESPDYDQRHPLLRTLTVPSSTLQTHGLEILLQAIAPTSGDVKVEPSSFLVPGLELLNSSAARYSVVRYPVHKALVFGDGFSNLSQYSAIAAAQSPENEMLKGAINTRWIDTLEHESSAMIVPVNIDHAEAAITTFRQSLENSLSYEHTWFSSGVPNLSTWLLSGQNTTSGAIKPTLLNLISSLLSATESRILASETEYFQTLASKAIQPSTRSEISNLITAWSEKGHTELRDQLSLAFSSPSWRKLAWWKLPWRVDDVGMIASDILQRSWLTSAEKELIWLVGRIEQAGLLPQEARSPPISTPPNAEVHASTLAGIIAPASGDSFSISDLSIRPSTPQSTKTKYPQTLSLARDALSSTTIPPLQSLAQSLLLHSLSTTFLTSTLSALVYVSISTTSVYEAGAIAALGLVYSMRRLQRRWEGARRVWRESVREEGRRVLRDAEGLWRGVVEREGGGDKGGDDGGGEERRVAREAVARVREALEARERR